MRSVVTALQAAIADFPPPQAIDVALTGEVALAHEEMSAALGGVELAGLLSLFFLAVILHFGIRSPAHFAGLLGSCWSWVLA
jgi:hypothetical protein